MSNYTSDVSLVLIEIGNEPNLYNATNNGVPYYDWNPLNYSRSWSSFAKAVADEFTFSSGLGFQVGSFGGAGNLICTPQSTFIAGTLDELVVKNVKTCDLRCFLVAISKYQEYLDSEALCHTYGTGNSGASHGLARADRF